MIERDYYQYYLYRHVRLDTNQVFYIGRGKAFCRPSRRRCADTNSYAERYARAFDMHTRNKAWKNIKKQSAIEVEILFESDSMDIINEKEKEFIELYGRICKGTGSLINITAGGEGQAGMNEAAVEKLIESQKKIGLYDKLAKERRLPIYLYDLSGRFLRKFETKIECADFLNCSIHSIQAYITNKKALNDCLLSRMFSPLGMNVSEFNCNPPKSRSIIKYDLNFNVIAIYGNQKEAIAAEKGATPAISIWRGCNQEKPIRNIYWRYADAGHKLKGGSYEVG